MAVLRAQALVGHALDVPAAEAVLVGVDVQEGLDGLRRGVRGEGVEHHVADALAEALARHLLAHHQLGSAFGQFALLRLLTARVASSEQRRAGTRDAAQGRTHVGCSRHTLRRIDARIERHGRPLTLVLRDAFFDSSLRRLAGNRLQGTRCSSTSKALAAGQKPLSIEGTTSTTDNGRQHAGSARSRHGLVRRGAALLRQVVGRASSNAVCAARRLHSLASQAVGARRQPSTLHRQARPSERACSLRRSQQRVLRHVLAHGRQLAANTISVLHLLSELLLQGLDHIALRSLAGLNDVLVDPARDIVAGLDEVRSLNGRVVQDCEWVARLGLLVKPGKWVLTGSR